MVRTSFLPSDDNPRLNYHVPGNAFAVVELRGAAKLLRALHAPGLGGMAAWRHRGTAAVEAMALADDAEALAATIDGGIRKWGVVTHGAHGARVFAMEVCRSTARELPSTARGRTFLPWQVDGYGNHFFGDDANPPSLLSLPYIGYVDATDATYVATRALLLDNETNPYYYGEGGAGAVASGAMLGGIGSEDASGNAGLGHVWALSLCIRLLTLALDGSDDAEATARELQPTTSASHALT
jgi:meiotically up-regulated gene 157 (Mug157) protein